jgi:uncharacterized protein (TIGR02145 family)
MKTHSIYLSLFLLFVFNEIVAQNIELTFSAEYNNQHIMLDSIYIKNLSQGSDTVLYYPDTVLIISNVGMHEFEIPNNNLSVSQNYPNPFANQTSVNVFLPEDELISVSVFDIMGRKLANYENNICAGNHIFTFYPCATSFYFLSVATKHEKKTIKMLGYDNKTSEQCKLVYGGMNDSKIAMKTEKSYFLFSDGDLLSYIGYATITGNKGSGFIEDNPNSNEYYMFDIGEDGIPCPEMPFISDIDGNIYQTVRIGSQCWMKENLKTTRYSDGTAINYPGSSSSAWTLDTIGAYCWINNDTIYKHMYGALYNWYAVSNSSGLCPPGWHVPTDEEWCKLENYIERYADPDCNLAGVINKRGENTARILKSCLTTAGTGISAECETDLHPRWTYYNDSTFGYDTYGFSALPGGWRWGNNYYNVGGRGFWWTSSEFIEDDTNYGGILRISYSNNSSINRNIMPFYFGYSVRCVKD